MSNALAAFVGGLAGSTATHVWTALAARRRRPPVNPAAAALNAALAGRPDPRAPRDGEPGERPERRPRLPVGI